MYCGSLNELRIRTHDRRKEVDFYNSGLTSLLGNPMSVKIKGLIDEAETFLKVAREEFKVAVAKNDLIRIRDSAEKAWNAVVNSTNGLLLALTGKLPLSHYERRVMLRGGSTP